MMNKNTLIRVVMVIALGIMLVISDLAYPLQNFPESKSLSPIRVAVIGFIGTSAQIIRRALTESLAKDERVLLLDEAQIKPALSAFGYNGSINMSNDEAKHLGASMGCDFFIVGKTDLATRSERAGETHEESFVGMLMVDARSGTLAIFDFILKKAAAREDAEQGAAQALSQQTQSFIEKMIAFRASRQTIPTLNGEPVEDLPDTESAVGADFKPPEFLNRVKPEFTEIADRADINATVEARVVFRANGQIGEIEIIRWAGFGLDEAATQAIKQLKFKPAMRQGQAINSRGVIRYNFRRVNQR